MKKEIFLKAISYAFVLLFVYTALSKWFTYPIYLYDLKRSPELGSFAVPISIVIPAAELIVAGLLLSRYKRIGLLLSILLMTLFTLYVAYIVIFTEGWPCTCGGIIRELSWPQHLLFNIFFTGLALCGWFLSKKAYNNSSSINPLNKNFLAG